MIHTRNLLPFLILLAAFTPAFGQSGPTVHASAVTEFDSVPAGQTARILVQVSLSEGWHVNAHEPLDPYLIPTELTIADNPVFQNAHAVYPPHHLVTLSFSSRSSWRSMNPLSPSVSKAT